MSSQEGSSGTFGSSQDATREGVTARGALPPLVLFVSNLNTGAAIMAEAILRHFAQGRMRAASAGGFSQSDALNPDALRCLQSHGIATKGLQSKVWGEFYGLNKPPVRYLIALADVYAAKASWPEGTLIARGDTPEPTDLVARRGDVSLAFEATYSTLHARIHKLLAIPFEQLDDLVLLQELAGIGRLSP